MNRKTRAINVDTTGRTRKYVLFYRAAFLLLIASLFILSGCSDSSDSDDDSSLTNPTTSSSTGTSAPYTQSGGTVSKTNQTYTASNTDESAVHVTNGGTFTLTSSTIATSGNTSSQENSSFYGLDAAVLAESASAIHLSDSTISTTGTGANGAFAVGSGSLVTLSNVTITATADGGHGVMATQGGTLTLDNVNITTSGGASSAIATDRGSGTITVTGGTVRASGQNSAGIYSTGVITVSNGTFTATGAEAAVIEGSNSIELRNCTLSSTKNDKWGVMIYQSMSGDAEGGRGVFTMSGGSLSYTGSNGPLFYVTNSTGVITLAGVSITAASGTLVNASAGNWGVSGANGGTVILTTQGQSLTGNMIADSLSSITVSLQNGSSWKGSANPSGTGGSVNVTMDASSTWNVMADSHVNCLTNSAGISGDTASNIISNGHTVYYNSMACSALKGNAYVLNGGGVLKPAN